MSGRKVGAEDGVEDLEAKGERKEDGEFEREKSGAREGPARTMVSLSG